MGEIMSIRAIAFREKECWIAQCLEYDISAQARSADELTTRLLESLSAEYDIGVALVGRPFGNISKAPTCFQRAWEKPLEGDPNNDRTIAEKNYTITLRFIAGFQS